MSRRQLTIPFVGAAAMGVGLLGICISSTFAAPANGFTIGAPATSAGELSEKVIWRGCAGGWRGVGWRGGVGWGWRPGLAAAGLAATGVATAAAAYNYRYGDYGYGPHYGPTPYIVTPGYYGGYDVTPNYGYTAPSYGYLPYP